MPPPAKLDKMRSAILAKSPRKIFIVCSYGGCGSKMLCAYLRQFGAVKHVHSRYPPAQLTHVGLNEWFSESPVNPADLPNYYVIYIYRAPVKAILSRFGQAEHLAHIQTNPATTLQDVITRQQDLYGIENFFDNYTTPAIKRNYKIYCVKYEDFFNKLAEFNRVFNIHCSKAQYPAEHTTPKTDPSPADMVVLDRIYGRLHHKMQHMPFIKVV